MEEENKSPAKIAARLDAAMKDMKRLNGKPWKQSDLEAVSKVPQATISRILKGTQIQGPESGTIRKLADALKVHVVWLAEGEGPQKRQDHPSTLRIMHVSDAHLPESSTTLPVEMPRAIPMVMTGPHFLTPDEWLLVSLLRRTDETGRKDLLAYAGSLKLILNPPIASNDPE